MRYGTALSVAKTPLAITLIHAPFQRVTIFSRGFGLRSASRIEATNQVAVPMATITKTADEEERFAPQTMPRSKWLYDGVRTVLSASELLTKTSSQETTGLSASEST